jgi:hypothetical protein
MKTFKKHFGYMCLILCCGLIMYCVFYPVLYWFEHDYLTKMQIFKKFWIHYLLSVFCAVVLDKFL